MAITDKQRKKILADYAEYGTYTATAKANGVSHHTVKRIIEQEPNFAEKILEKKEQNTADILSYMESKRKIVCEIIDRGLNALNNDEKLSEASPAQITTALGTLIDKWTGICVNTFEEVKEDGLSKSLRELAEKGLNSDD